MLHNFKTFGFKTIAVNGYPIYTCNISISRTEQLPEIAGVQITETTRLAGKQRTTKQMTTLSYATTNAHEHERLKIAVGLFLKSHAIDKITAKYHWTEPVAEQQLQRQFQGIEELCF